MMRELEQRYGRLPTDDEMAEALDLSAEAYQNLLTQIQPATFICLDSVRSQEHGDRGTQYEGLADEHQASPGEDVARHELKELIAERIKQLPEVQRKVLALYYFEDLRLWEIAEAFGVTESRICQIHAQAIQFIKASLRKQDPLVV
jgi:RNA polymerase sigma factor for flagellar operon FliA